MASKTSYSRARENLASLWDEVEASREPAIIQRRGHEDMALLPADELASLRETAYLLRSPHRTPSGSSPPSHAGAAAGARPRISRRFDANWTWRRSAEREAAIPAARGSTKPEPRKYLGGKVWSHQINESDRLVYEDFEDRVEFLRARYHY